jgi:hypothetical protein
MEIAALYSQGEAPVQGAHFPYIGTPPGGTIA